MFQFIKCHILDEHKDCWIISEYNKTLKAMCPYCRKLVYKSSDGKWRTYKGVIL